MKKIRKTEKIKDRKFQVIVISGTPCTGKTTLAKKLSEELSFALVSQKELLEKKQNRRQVVTSEDAKRNVPVVDEKKFAKMMLNEIRKIRAENAKLKRPKRRGIIVEGHITHFLPANEVDLCIILNCTLPNLKSRLERRGYSSSKVRENLDAEIFDTCRQEAEERGHKIAAFDERTPLRTMINRIRGSER